VSSFEEAVIQRINQLEREVERLKRWERPIGGGGVTDHGALTGLADNDHPQYLLTTGKAADSDKLDGNDSSYFSPTTHNHDHDTLINFVANKHIDHSGVSITAGAGLTGGGNLTATRTIALSHLGFQSLTDPNADRVLFWDDSAGALKWLQVDGIVGTALGQWTSFTPTYTGWTSGTVTGTFKYSVIGNIVFLLIDMTAGTSNSTFADIDLPVNADLNSNYGGANALAINNGVTLSVATRWFIGGTSQVISFRTDMATGLWTASGTKRVRCLAIYAKGT